MKGTLWRRGQLSCTKMDFLNFSLLLFFCFELLHSQVTSFYVFSLFHFALTPPSIPRIVELISSPIKILLPALPKVSGRSEEKVFHSTEKLLLSCLHVFLRYFTKDLWEVWSYKISNTKVCPKSSLWLGMTGLNPFQVSWIGFVEMKREWAEQELWNTPQCSLSLGTSHTWSSSFAPLRTSFTQHWKPLGNLGGGGVVSPACLNCYFLGGFIQHLMKFWGPPTSLIRRWLKLHFG